MAELIDTVQQQTIGEEYVMLFDLILDSTTNPETAVHFYPGFNEADTGFDSEPRDYQGEVVFKDYRDPNTLQTYFPLPCELDGFEVQSDGAQNRPTFSIANVLDHFSDSLDGFTNEKVLGKKLRVRSTLRRNLQAPVGEDTADGQPAQEFPVQTYIIDRIEQENELVITFELSSPFDLTGVKIPGRIAYGQYCSWTYQGRNFTPPQGACNWALNSQHSSGDTFYFNIKDEPIIKKTVALGFPEYSAVTTYNKGDYVKVTGADSTKPHNGTKWYRLLSATATGVTPGTTGVWLPVRVWTEWRTGETYIRDEVEFLNNPYVRYSPTNSETDKTVWLLAQPHISTTQFAPKIDSPYWSKGDLCGKTIASCKARYQAYSQSGSGETAVPYYETDTTIVLPFGGFPGTNKFR